MGMPVAWTSRNRKTKQKWRRRERMGKTFAWFVRMVWRIYGTCWGWNCSSSQGRTCEFFSWISFRALGKVVSGKHSIFTHFPKEKDCDICLRTKITRGPCRRRTCTAVLRAEKFGDLITADHKVLSDNCESRNNHRHAVVVQDFGYSMESYQCKTKKRACRSSWSRRGNQKPFTLTNP